MNRLYVVENRFTLTGAMADHRLRCPGEPDSGVRACACAKNCRRRQTMPGWFGSWQLLQAPASAATFRRAMAHRSGQRSSVETGASLVLAGPHQPVAVQLLVYAINSALKNVGHDAGRPRVCRRIRARTAFCNWRRTSTTAGSSNFSFSAAIRFTTRRAVWRRIARQTSARLGRSAKKGAGVVRLGYYEDATSALSHWHVPAAHYLESWGDALTAERRLPVDPADDLAALRRTFGNRIAQCAAGRSQSRRAGTRAGNFSRHKSAGRFSNGVVPIPARRLCLARAAA